MKEIFAEPPSEESIRVELDFAQRAGECGIRVPRSHPDRAGRYLVNTLGGRWLRCFDWVDLRPIPVGDAGTPRRLGEMLACLHRRAPTTAVEPYDGGPPDPWYDRAPAPDDWVTLSRSGPVWAERLCQQVDALQSMCS
ncbi:MAG TPA: hypothetical protein VMD51_16455, partial [Mycobacterium sp.]|nr:hypothetical protein [Mycobacterium sp.]